MNKNLYRVIFHKALGRMVVVAECTKNQGKSRQTVSVSSGSNTQPSSSIFQKSASILTLSVWTVLASLGFMSSSYAHGQTQIIADKTAPKSEQAVILPTANGLTQVNIQTPSQAGVSKNQYSQFDVGQQGAILNNSRTHVKTQLAGFVEANPYLARGEAKVILNQVNSNNPSQLKGYVEVAGKRAEVVIANPSGIQVDGGGFINAGGAVLSTGQAQFDAQGNITHYHISNGQQGKIQIDGQGLNANGADYTKLISQYNQVNAHVIAGQGDIEVQTGTSLDVSKLGGMYAGKIRLVGTEKGLGVTQATAFNTNNAGIVSAKASLTLDSQGNLVNTGTLASEQQLDLNVNKLSNETGQIIANQADIRLQQDYTHSDAKQIQANALSLSTQGKLTNTQHLTSNDKLVLQAKQIENQGVINSQQTTLTASETIDNLGAKIYGTQLQIDAKTLNNTPISTFNPKKVDFCQVGTGCVLEVIDKETHQQTWLSKEYLDKFEKLKQTEPTQYAEILKKYQFNYYTVDLGKAPIIGARENLKINVATLNNHPNSARKNTFNSDFNGQSLIVSQGDLDITANTFNNIGASIESTGDMRISAQTLNNKNADYETRIVELDKVDETRFHGLNGLNPTQYKPDEITEHTGQGVDGSIRTMHVNGTNLSYKDYARLDYTKTLMGDKTMKSDPSRILSGADIRLNLNDFNTNKSQIIAGNTIQITGRVTNVDSEPTTITPYYHYNPSVITKYVYVIDGGERSVCVGNIAGCKYDITRVLGPTTNTIAPSKGKPYQLNILNIPDGQGINTAVSQDKTVTKNTDVVVPSLNSLNTSGLFQVSDKPNYVIETDPAFANGKIWLGSDFMTNRLGYQADHIHKRLGDGYYEQQLIKDQVLALTGKRYLADYRTDDAQYRALMDNAVSVAKPLNLRVGVALTAEQMAQLTTDIVWLVEQEVTLKDKNGQNYQQKVLVPRVYVRSHVSDLTGTGSLISARNVDLNLAGDLNNQGNIVAHEQLNVRAKNINNQQGGVIQGDFVQLNAQENINNLGATMKADSAMALSAGKDIKNQSTTYHHENHQGQSSGERTGIAQVASIYIGDGTKGKTDAQGKALTTLSINVDGQYIASAGQIHNAGGTTQLNAKQGVDLQAINVGYRSEAIADANNYHKQSEYQDVGSNITGQGDVIVRTQGNISATGTTLSSQQGRVALIANGGNSSIDIQEGRHTQSLETAYRLKERHLVGSTSVQDRYSAQSNSTQSSVIDGKEVLISATQDVNLTAVQAISDEQTIVQAGRNVNINSAQNHSEEHYQHETKKSGLMGSGGIGFSIGSERNKQDNTQRTTTQIGSTIGSLQGDTTLVAEQKVQISGSTVSSPQGNVTVQGQQVTISSADNHYQHINKTEYEKKGISVSLNVPTIDTVKNTIQAVQRIGDSKNDRVNAMASANGAWKVYQLYDKLNELGSLKNLGTDVSVSISYGEQKNTTEQVVTGSTAQASQVMAGGTVNVRASGAGERSNIEIVGSDVVGKQGTHLVAEHDVNILSAEQRHTEQSNNRSQGWNAGANIGKGGVGATLGGNHGKGSGNGEERTHRHSTVGDEQGATRITGDHLTVKGGQVVGDTVQVDANQLSMQSVQDTATYHGKQQQISGQATIGYGASVNANYNRSKIDADYASVSTQTGIFAGDGGFDIKVKQHTDLTGAVITSSEQAERAGNNRIQTGTLAVSDINNHSHYDGQSIAIGANVNVSGKTLGQKAPKDGASAQSSGNDKQFNLSQLQVVATENSAGVTGIGIGRDSDSQQSTTKGGIYTSNVIITNKAEQERLAKTQGQTLEQNIANAKIDISTDEFSQQGAKANGALNNNFDKDQVQKELNVQTEVTKQFSQTTREVKLDIAKKEEEARDNAKNKREEAKEKFAQGDESKAIQLLIEAEREEEKAQRLQHGKVAVDVVSQALSASSGGTTGQVVSALSPAGAYAIGQYFKNNASLNEDDEKRTSVRGTRAEEGSVSHLLAHGLLALAVGSATGQSPETITTTAITTMGAEKLAPALGKLLSGSDKVEDLTAEQKQTVSNILGTVGVVAGVVTAQATGADSMSSVSAGQQVQSSVQNAVENNYQSVNTLINFNYKLSKCSKKDKACIAEAVNYLRKMDSLLDKEFDDCVKEQDTKCQHRHLFAILESDQSNELKTAKKLMQEYKISTQVFPFLNDKDDPENRDTGLSRLAAEKINDVRKGHNIGCVSGTTTSCISPIKELPLNHKVFNAINDATIGQIEIAFGIKRASATEREKAVANLISLGVMRAPAGVASLTDDAILAIEKKYSKEVVHKLIGRLEPDNPLSTSLPRNGSRLVIRQADNMPTCGPTSCAMVLDTFGHKVDVQNIIQQSNVTNKGTYLPNLVSVLKRNNVNATFNTNVSIEKLSEVTAKGNPAIVAMLLNRGGHAVVVDGITTRQGKVVVAIRDPALGRQYFTPIEEFKQKFSGQAIFTNGSISK